MRTLFVVKKTPPNINKGTGEVTWNDKAYDFIQPETNYFETEDAITLDSTSRTKNF